MIEQKYDPNYPLECLGISNGCYAKDSQEILPKTTLGIQFFEIDVKAFKIDDILKIFPFDCVCLETKRGFHFISFAVIRHEVALRNVKKMNIEFPDNDYGKTRLNYLILRISAKRDIQTKKLVSPKPKFYKILRKPCKNLWISARHLSVYKNLLPKGLFKYYTKKCQFLQFGLREVYYRTSDKLYEKVL